MDARVEKRSYGRWVPFNVAAGSFLGALIIWCFSSNYFLSVFATAGGIGALIAAGITAYKQSQKKALEELGIFILLWWLFTNPWAMLVFGDITGLLRLYLELAKEFPILGSNFVKSFLYYGSAFWLIPAGLIHLGLVTKTGRKERN